MGNKRGRINEIDLLRFIAALSVVFFHYAFRGHAADNMCNMSLPLLASLAKYGYLGVDLFFMVSGFVILLSAHGGILKKFVVSRIIRLYPAFWICCSLTFIVTIIHGDIRYSASLSQYLANMSLLSGFMGIPSIDGAYWSLFIEIKFYVLVACLLFVRKIENSEFFLAAWLIFTYLLEFCPFTLFKTLLITNYSAYFIAGAMFFLIWSKGISKTRIGAVILSWGFALFKAIKRLEGIEIHYNNSMNEYVVGGIITFFFIALFLVSIRKTGCLMRKNYFFIGGLTYPLYLIHQNIVFMIFNSLYLIINPYVLFVCVVTLMIFVSYIINRFIEQEYSEKLRALAIRSWDAGGDFVDLFFHRINSTR